MQMRTVVLASMVLLTGCVKRKPLLVLPSAQELRVKALEKENASLRKDLLDLTKSCTAVLRVFKESGNMSRLPRSREK